MKRSVFLILFLLIPFTLTGQVLLRGGMGITFQNTPSFTDYINQNYASSLDELGDFNSAIIFSVEGGYMYSETFELALEIGYLINSYTYNYDFGRYEFAYNSIMPSLIGYYVIGGEGYQIKFGGGAGLRIIDAEETQPVSNIPRDYTSTGFGILLRADGNTLLGKNFYANIGADIRYDINDELKRGDVYLYNDTEDERVSLNALGFLLRLGVVFIF